MKFLFYFLVIGIFVLVFLSKKGLGCFSYLKPRLTTCLKDVENLFTDYHNHYKNTNVITKKNYIYNEAYRCGLAEINDILTQYREKYVVSDDPYLLKNFDINLSLYKMQKDALQCLQYAKSEKLEDIIQAVGCCTGSDSYFGKGFRNSSEKIKGKTYKNCLERN